MLNEEVTEKKDKAGKASATQSDGSPLPPSAPAPAAQAVAVDTALSQLSKNKEHSPMASQKSSQPKSALSRSHAKIREVEDEDDEDLTPQRKRRGARRNNFVKSDDSMSHDDGSSPKQRE